MRWLFLRAMPRKDDPFVTFCTTHVATIIGILWKIGVREADIPDIVQLVLIKVHQNWETLSKKQVALWLETICRQQAAEHYRLHRNRFESPEPDVGEGMASEKDAHAEFERHEIDQVVHRVLATMDPEQRDLLVRREFQDESLESIAKAYGIVRNTAHARIAEAKRIFRLRAERILGDKGFPIFLVPFDMEAVFSDWEVPQELVNGIHRRVWGNLAKDLGYDAANPPSLTARAGENDVPDSKTDRVRFKLDASPRRWIKPLAKPLILLSTAGLGALGGAFLWPHDSPAIARHTPVMIGPIVIKERVNMDAVSGAPLPLTSSSQRTAIASSSHANAPAAPQLERELSDLERARKLLAQGQHADALEVLRQHARDFPRSDLAAIRQRYMTLAEEGIRKGRSPQN